MYWFRGEMALTMVPSRPPGDAFALEAGKVAAESQVNDYFD